MWNEMGKHTEVLMQKLGITMDNSMEDREKFMALEELMAAFAKEVVDTEKTAAQSIDWWMETAEEYLVG